MDDEAEWSVEIAKQRVDKVNHFIITLTQRSENIVGGKVHDD
jgi:hypothetical protein